MSFFQKRSVAIFCCIVMIVAALGIGSAKSRQTVLPVQGDLPDGWSEVYEDADYYGQPEHTILGTSLRVIGGIAVFLLLIGTLVLLSVISAISRLGKRLLFGTRSRNGGRSPIHSGHSSHKPPPRGHYGGRHHGRDFNGKR